MANNAAPNMEEYTRTFSSFSGADITATFGGRIIGELQAISYSIVREVAPVYTMGSPDPRTFSRGKRGISGNLIFTQFDRDALLEEMNKNYQYAPVLQTFQQYRGNMEYQNDITWGAKSSGKGYGISTWDDVMTKLGYGVNATGNNAFDSANTVGFYKPEYADQLMPFNITINGANEFGQRMGMEVYGIQILNEGSGYSVDDVVSAKAYTFVARKIKGVESKENLRTSGQDSFWGSVGNSFKNVFA